LSKCLYLIAKREKWNNGEDFFNVDNILKNFTEEIWGIGNLKEIYKGMNGLVKIAEDKNSDNFYKKHNCEKLKAGIYCTFEILEIFNNQTIKIKILDNFYKMGNIIGKEKLIEILGENYYTAQKPIYLDCQKYKNIKKLGIELNFYKNTEELAQNDTENLIEGAKRQVTVNAFERNPKARQECIKYYGTKCNICNFDFEKQYGEIGKGFIHIHHIKPLSEINEEYEVNPIQDLRPVCPNCHAMIHKRNPPYSMEEIQSLLTKKTYNNALDDE
jgi:predicted restriction endonuclease